MFFFDKILGLYINDSPLLVSSRVVDAARAIDVDIHWNSEGHICGVSHDVGQALSRKLGITTLSVREFMALARREPRVASPEFAEWLADLYTLSDSGQVFNSRGEPIEMPIARPGWFDVADVDDRGLPTKLSTSNIPGKWKFWSPGHTEFTCGAMRSFVTSSGTCSLDLGIPTFAKHPMIMIRECYRTKKEDRVSQISSIWNEYESLTHGRDDALIRKFLSSLKLEELEIGNTMDDFINDKEREMSFDLIGKRRLFTGDFDGLRIVDRSAICEAMSVTADEDTTFVIGHPHPDADSIVSAVFEATRRSLAYPTRKCLAWAESLPREARHMLGPEISGLLDGVDIFGFRNDIVLVDCHAVSDTHTHQVRSIIDHHIVKGKFPYYVALSQEVSWSSTLQVYIKMLGSGMDVDPGAARILMEATRLEAEPRLVEYMSEADKLAMERLNSISGRMTSYVDLMGLLTDIEDEEERFYKDYKQTTYGFSVIKCRVSRNYDEIARSNNSRHYLPLTIVKEVVYDRQFASILFETISMVFNNDFHDKGFTDAVASIIKEACEAFHGKETVSTNQNAVIVRDVKVQTPRLLLMPLVEDMVKEHLKFAYSKTISMYVPCGFFSGSSELYGRPGEVETHSHLSFRDVKELLRCSKNTSFMSLPQYWRVYEEFRSRHDTFSMKSMRDKTYVELLDTIIFNKSEVKNGDHDPVTVNIQESRPSLIRPEDGDPETGIPRRLTSPDTYGDASLWRYWSPDAKENVATRGHIFVMDQTCIDLKIGPDERTKRLTFRPLYRDIPDIMYQIRRDSGRWVELVVIPRLFSIYEL